VGALGEPQHSVISQPRYPADLHSTTSCDLRPLACNLSASHDYCQTKKEEYQLESMILLIIVMYVEDNNDE
jgi:hypothetical protein